MLCFLGESVLRKLIGGNSVFLGGEFSQHGNIKKSQWERYKGFFSGAGWANFFVQKSPFFEEKRSHVVIFRQ